MAPVTVDAQSCKTFDSWSHDHMTCYKKVLKGRQFDVGSGLAGLAERQIQEISY